MKNLHMIYSLILSLFLAASTANAAITSPEPNTQLQTGSITLQWENSAATNYRLRVYKNSPDGMLVWGSNQISETSATFTIPNGSSSIYVTLIEEFGEASTSKTFYYPIYEAGSQDAPNMISPTALSVLDSTTVTFEWDDIDAVRTVAKIGSSRFGSTEYGHISYIWDNKVTVSNLPTDGSAVYLRLHFYKDGVWSVRDFAFTSAY